MMTTATNNGGDMEALAQDFTAALNGRPVATVDEAAKLLACHTNTIRRALQVGELTGSRRANNGPILIRCRELARWVLAGEQRSLPMNTTRNRRKRQQISNHDTNGNDFAPID